MYDLQVMQIIFGTVLTALSAAVGWLIVTVIITARKVAVLEAQDCSKDIARIHARIDDIAGTVSRTEGEIKQLIRQMHLINEYLLAQRDD